jgi:hypothetical protein
MKTGKFTISTGTRYYFIVIPAVHKSDLLHIAELKEWCTEQFGPMEIDTESDKFRWKLFVSDTLLFSKKSDLTLFKLTWG